MGAYLTIPKTEKVSSDESNSKIICGASSMQGWRRTQEDAHNSILQYDEEASLFAVYDGHGGKEVAEYTARELPEFLKKTEAYQSGDYIEALKEAFLKFDATLKTPEVVAVLKEIADNGNNSETDDENLGNLKEEAEMPIEEVMAKYVSTVSTGNPSIDMLKGEDMKLATPVSPSLRAKGSSSSAGASSASMSSSSSTMQETIECSEVSLNKAECSSSRSNMYCNEAEAEVSSSSSTEIPRKSLSEKYSNGGSSSSSKTLLDSTSNGTDVVNNEENECKDFEIENINSNSDSSSVPIEAQSKAKTEEKEESSDLPDSSEDLNKTDSSATPMVNGNGTHLEEAHAKVEDGISSSVENGEVKSSKGKGKGKALVKKQPKTPEKKETESPEQLFKKFVDSEPAEEDSDSDSDDVTFTGPDSTSDDEDVGETGEAEGEEEEDEDEEDSEEYDEDEEEDDEEDDEFTMNMTEELRQYLRSDGSVNTLRDSSVNSRRGDEDEDKNKEEKKEKEKEDEDEDDECCEKTDEFGKNFLINVLKKKVPGSDSGCTAVVALIKGNKIYVANAGDSRCIVSKNGEVVEMSLDHKPEDDLEMARIVKAGGKVTMDGRVNGGLNLSRALGDHVYKQVANLSAEEQMISPLPDVKIIDIDPDVEFMVLACDGIWNFMSSLEVVNFVRPRLQKCDQISKICEELFDHCLAPNTQGDGTGCDNMTAIIVQFLNSSSTSQKKRRTDEEPTQEDKRQKTEDVSSTDSRLE